MATTTSAPPRGGEPRHGPRRRPELSLEQARRTAVRAQGLDRRRGPAAGPPTLRHLVQVVDRTGLLQIDSVNVLARAHLVPVYSRIGPYDPALLDRAAGVAPRRLVETWAHEASYVPPETYRLLGWRRRDYLRQAWGTISEVPLRHSSAVDDVRNLVAELGPVTAREVHAALETGHVLPRTAWGWNWSVAKRVLEFLFYTGEVAAARRTASFERCYDLTERVLPPEVLARPEPDDDEAVRALVEIAARAHGVATAGCLADYFRIRGPRVPAAVASLVEDGVLLPVTVRGWDRPTYLHRDAVVPRSVAGRALLSPFDPLVFERRRLEELFGTRYRIEIYVPAHARVHGYYVLPFLLGDRVVARVDLKAERARGVLRVQSAHAEEHAPAGVGEALVEELRALAGWLALADVALAPAAGGDLAGRLALPRLPA